MDWYDDDDPDYSETKEEKRRGKKREEHWTLTLPVNEDPRARNARQMDR